MTAEQVYAMLKKRINSNGVSQEKIEKAVESYLERNPISNLDVRIGGESIVQDGVAEIPMMGVGKSGLIQFRSGYGLQLIGNYLLVKGATETEIINRTGSRLAIFADRTLDYAVKVAMCDGKGADWTAEEQAAARERMRAWSGDWQIIMDETLTELAKEVSFKVPDNTKEMICFFKSGATVENTAVYLHTKNSGASVDESFAAFGGSLTTNAISIGCQKIQFLSSQYGLIEYSYLSHSTPSSSDYAQRVGKTSVLRIDDKRFFFDSVNQNTGYPVGTRLLVFVRR